MGNVSRAADNLCVTQPTVSRQLKELEEELGEKLFERTNYAIRLTPAGELLRERAEDILSMADRTVQDFKSLKEDEVVGEIAIACAESRNVNFLSKCIAILRDDYPKIKYNLYSGDSERALEKLDKGIFDFAVVVDNVDLEKYNCLAVRSVDRWGVVMRRDDPLAKRDFIEPKDLLDKPLMASRQAMVADLPKWFGDDISRLNVIVGLLPKRARATCSLSTALWIRAAVRACVSGRSCPSSPPTCISFGGGASSSRGRANFSSTRSGTCWGNRPVPFILNGRNSFSAWRGHRLR